MQVAVEPFNFLLLPANIQYFSVLKNGQLSKGCRFDALRDLRDTRLALLCLICKVSDVSVNHVSVNHQMCVSCIHNILVRNRFELAFINTTEIVLQPYLFPLLIEVACFVIKSAIIIFVFLLRKSTKVCLHL